MTKRRAGAPHKKKEADKLKHRAMVSFTIAEWKTLKKSRRENESVSNQIRRLIGINNP